MQQLTNAKNEIENNLRAKTSEMNNIVQQLAQINSSLVQQIELINTVADELGDIDNSDVGNQFQAIGSNIQAIVNMINGSTGRTVGGRRRKTCRHKSCRKRSCKRHMKGGYVYSSNKELDKSSTVVSGSASNSKTKKRKDKKKLKSA